MKNMPERSKPTNVYYDVLAHSDLMWSVSTPDAHLHSTASSPHRHSQIQTRLEFSRVVRDNKWHAIKEEGVKNWQLPFVLSLCLSISGDTQRIRSGLNSVYYLNLSENWLIYIKLPMTKEYAVRILKVKLHSLMHFLKKLWNGPH